MPIGFMSKGDLSSDSVHITSGASLYHFGILTSSIHNLWLKTIGGRLKSDYRYSKDIVYNNFPWPKVNKELKEKIEITAQQILNIRKKYPTATLAEMYSNLDIFEELKQAHQENDLIVMEAYGIKKGTPELEILKHLFKMWKKLS